MTAEVHGRLLMLECLVFGDTLRPNIKNLRGHQPGLNTVRIAPQASCERPLFDETETRHNLRAGGEELSMKQ